MPSSGASQSVEVGQPQQPWRVLSNQIKVKVERNANREWYERLVSAEDSRLARIFSLSCSASRRAAAILSWISPGWADVDVVI